jgi:hypothetical protein
MSDLRLIHLDDYRKDFGQEPETISEQWQLLSTLANDLNHQIHKLDGFLPTDEQVAVSFALNEQIKGILELLRRFKPEEVSHV